MKRTVFSMVLVCLGMVAWAQSGCFCLSKDGQAAQIVVDGDDWPGVIRAARDLGDDVRKVSGTASPVVMGKKAAAGSIVVGTIGKSQLIDGLIRQKKIDVSKVRGQWESYLIDVVDGSLVIAGSDKRGTIYGIYEISQRIGVSPWYWWADVPVAHKDEVWYDGGRILQPSPKVKYRGIFINDEWPSFGTWCQNQFGGINSKAYCKIFELLLRLKANYLWPAMWDSRFNEDDPDSPRLADEYGIVMGTSHHEPMMRAHKEYVYRKDSVGPWDYSINQTRLDRFFRKGMERNKRFENLVTVGMRGDGDVAMGTGNDADNMKTLRRVIDGQRKIIKDIYGRPDGVPQLWAIFTEVQRYYDAGFTVPNDVTLLLCDNNWGYIRRKGRDFEHKRKGGLGLYYHIDMNGGPWNDRWVNTTTIPKLREQLHLAYASGIDRIWIINVGDLKPKEVPIDFIMHYAWNPNAIQPGDERGYLEDFTRSIFGEPYAKETADIIAKYSKYNLWRKAEAQVPGLFNREEMLWTDHLWQSLVLRCEALREQMPAEMQDAFYQLVYYPAVASAGVAQIYNSATTGDSETVTSLMAKDQRLSDYYNNKVANGKWRGMMSDNHIGYTKWFIPEQNFDPMTLGYKVTHNLNPSDDTKEYTIPAYDYTRKDDGWIFLPDLGRGEGCMGAGDVMMPSAEQGDGPRLEYEIDLTEDGQVAIGILPTQDILPARGLRLGVQLDDQPLQMLDARRGLVDTFLEYTPQNLAVSKVLKPLPPRSELALSGCVDGRQLLRRDELFDNIRWLDISFKNTPGRHTLKIVMVDPEVVVEQIVVNPDNQRYSYFGKPVRNNFGKGRLTVKKVARNAVRIRYQESEARDTLPDWLYVKHDEVDSCDVQVEVDHQNQTVTLKDRNGQTLFHATRHELLRGGATLAFDSPQDECLFGLGQFQDGYSNVRGLSRRLTQVNTQISLPMLLSSKGYGILWNNYGLTEFNPCGHSVKLERSHAAGGQEVVNVTSTEGGRQEVRERHLFEADFEVFESGDYALLLDVGQNMARRHHLMIDGQTVIDMQNLWLPPTASRIVHINTGHHHLTAELADGDDPMVYFDKVGDETIFRSPIANAVDYTVFTGSADEIIATYRDLTGQAPLMPDWALGYIHCRERFHSSQEILETANRFRQEQMPVSMIVQDWQYWGKHGWNAMQFDEDFYPDPKALTDSLHKIDIRLMLSVWSKIDKTSEVGQQMERDGHYIPGTDWIDFFSPEAAAAYWQHFRERLVPLGIDAWWQDATEPENDDLAGRRVNKGRWAGELVRNVYPLLVNKTVYEGLLAAGKEPMILTRCGFPGIQRYGSTLWSGDVGNDWETFRRQLTAGLGVQAAGIPWWTYDAGGFFRPQDQYTDTAYIERMLRWIETSVYLPLMRVHGYMSNTEPWNYGPEAQQIIADCLRERERLQPYIRACARRISEEGYTLMRPLVFDFASDAEALKQPYEYMFGPALLISPVTEPDVTKWRTYLPQQEGGWYDYRTGEHYDGGQYVTTPVTKSHIPVFRRAGFEVD